MKVNSITIGTDRKTVVDVSFTDDSDLFFEKLWKGDELTWAEIKGESEKLKSDEEIKAASSRRGTAAARAGRAG